MKILLADDHSLIRQGIEFLLEELNSEAEILHASTLFQILDCIAQHPIDFAIIDAQFPDGNSLEIITKIKKSLPEIKILIFSGADEATQSLKFIQAGANGFLTKLSDETTIIDAIRKVCKDGEYFSELTQDLLLESLRKPATKNPVDQLSDRELEIAKLYVKGLGNLEIANLLSLKQNTVSTVKKRIFDKLKIENIVELIDILKDTY